MVKNPEIRVPVSKDSIRSAKEMADQLARAQEETQQLLGNFKGIQSLLKSMKALGFQQGRPGGFSFNQALEGQRVRSTFQRDRLGFDGSNGGKRLLNEKEYSRYARDGLKFLEGQRRTTQALNLSARTRSNTLRQITNLQEAQNLKLAIEKRLGNEALQGKRSTVKAFERQLGVINEVVSRLQEEKRVTDQIAKARSRNIQLEKAQADRARRATQERLFGDGGAGLFRIQTGILANYAALNAGRRGAGATFNFTADLDEELRNLQAIVRITDNEMQGLKQSLIDISEATKFTAVEVAKASVTLGQAGLSTEEIQDAARAVTLLATATGTDLNRAVDIATSTLGVFRLESSNLAMVANTMTEAVNSSKLNIEKLTLGLQYSGNIAAQSGVRFGELAAALGAMANSGIRSGSTLGTGMRQVLIALQKPSGEFLKTVDRLGLTMDDLNLRTQGLYGVLKNLKDAGFTAEDAMRSFEVRAAAAFNALENNIEQVLELQSAFANSSAATKANETQMRAFTNQARRLGSVMGSVVETGFRPFLLLLRDVMSGLSDFGEWLREHPTLIRLVVTWTVAWVTALGSLKIKALVSGLLGLTGGIAGVTAAVRLAIPALFSFNALLGPLGLALTAGALAFAAFGRESLTLNNSVDRAQAAVDRASGSAEQLADQMGTITGKIQELRDRYALLSEDNAALEAEIDSVRAQFANMGYDVSSADGTIDGLIGSLQALRGELSKEYVIRLSVEGETLGVLAATLGLQRQAIARSFGSPSRAGASLPGPSGTIDEFSGVDGANGTATLPSFSAATIGPSLFRQLRSGEANDLPSLISAQARIQKRLAEINLDGGQRGEQSELETTLQNLEQYIEFTSDLNKAEKAVRDVQRKTGDELLSGTTISKNLGQDVVNLNKEVDDLLKASNSAASRSNPSERLGVLKDGTGQLRGMQDLLAAMDVTQAEIQGRVDAGELPESRGQALLTALAEARSRVGRREAGLKNDQRPLEVQSLRSQGRNLSSELRALTREYTDPKGNRAREQIKKDIEGVYDRILSNEINTILAGVRDADPNNLDPATLAQINDVTDTNRRELAETLKRPQRRAGGGGGGGRRKPAFEKEPFQALMLDLEDRLDRVEEGRSTGTVNQSTYLKTVQQVASEAERALTARQEELKVLREKARTSSLSAQENERANRLLSEEKKLVTFVRDVRRDIRDVSREIGVEQSSLNELVTAWSNENLNVGETFTSGIEGALGSAKSGLDSFFQSWTDGTKKGGDAFRDLGIGVVRALHNIFTQMMAVWILQQSLGWLSNSVGINIPSNLLTAVGLREGGVVPKRAMMGDPMVRGNINRDSQLYNLMPGEGILTRSAVQAIGGEQEIRRLNAMGNRSFASPATPTMSGQKEGGRSINFYLVDDRSQVPTLGPQDVVAIVGDDIARNGSTKKLIKSVQMGAI